MKSASAKFIFATVFLDTLGIGFLIPVLPDVIRRFSNDPTFVNTYYGYFIAVYSLLGFLTAPLLGSLSDKYGRRPLLLNSLLCVSIDYLLMGFAPNLTLLFLGRVISGITGATMTVANAYMSDISTDENRSANFGLIGAAWGIGFIIGPSLGGLLVNTSPKAPFLAAAAMNFINFFFGYFFVPETLPPEKRRNLSWQALNPFSSLFKFIRKKELAPYLWSFLLLYIAGQVHPSNWTLYTQYKFGWTAFDVGLSLSFAGVMIAFVQGYFTRIAIPKLGETRSVEVGMLIYIVSFALYSIVTKSWMMYAVTMFFAFSGISGPALQSIITKKTSASEQGELQGCLMAISNLTAVASPILYSTVFTKFTTGPFIFPGIAYALASVISIGSLLILLAMNNNLKASHETNRLHQS